MWDKDASIEISPTGLAATFFSNENLFLPGHTEPHLMFRSFNCVVLLKCETISLN